MLKQKSKQVNHTASDIGNAYLSILEQWAPQSVDNVEKAVIGMLLFNVVEEHIQLIDDIKPEIFYDEDCRRIFKSIQRLKNSGKINIKYPLVGQVVNYDSELTEKDLLKFEFVDIAHILYYVAILKQAAIIRAYYSTLCLAPRLFNDELDFDTFFDRYEELTGPIFDEIAKRKENHREFEEAQKRAARKKFVPHYIVRGEEKYKVLQSKYEPYDGYVWIDNRGVKEDKLLKEGFEIVYE